MKQFPVLALIIVSLAWISCQSNNPEKANQTADSSSTAAVDPLPSWNDGPLKQSIIDFVKGATDSGGKYFIPLGDRIATFDNDGTLWAEQPLYFQFFYAIARIRQQSTLHPEWKTKEPFKSILAGDLKTALASGEKGLLAMMAVTFAEMTGDVFHESVRQWADTARNPATKIKFTDMIYQPMLELLSYLRANGFTTFIVSGGDTDFMRAWAERAYGIPPYQVVGSALKVRYDVEHDTPRIQRLPELNFLDDGPGKPVGIYQHIGKKPVFSAGNSDGDYQMLQWTASNSLPHMEIIIHHTDSVREWAYDRNSHIGKLDKGLDDAPKYGWKIIDMKNEWKKIFPAK